MSYVLVFLIGILAGIFFMAMTTSAEINDIEMERINAESRALTHFRKLFKIEQLLRQAEKDKTPSVIVVDKIKEAISSDQTTDNF